MDIEYNDAACDHCKEVIVRVEGQWMHKREGGHSIYCQKVRGQPRTHAVPESCALCGEHVVFPSNDHPMFAGDTALTAKCRHAIRFLNI